MKKLSSLGDALRKVLDNRTGVSDEDTEITIHIAAKQGDCDKIVEFCESKVDLNQVDSEGQTALYIAALNSHLKVVEVLLQHGASQVPELCDLTRNYPLHVARDASIADALIRYGGNVNETNFVNETALHKALLRRSNLDLINVLLSNKSEITARTEEGLTPLHCALNAYDPNTDIVSRLINAGANVNDTDYTGRTPLHHYCRGYQLSTNMLSLLIAHKCRLDIRDYEGNCPIHSYITTRQDTDKDFLRLLCLTRDSTNLSDYRGMTPLILAILNLNVDDISLLIHLGADVNATDNLGKTALHYASSKQNNGPIVDLLIQHGVDINCEDWWGRTPLFDYVDNKDVEGCRILMRHGTSVEHQDKCGLGPLHIACLRGKKQLVLELIENGSNVNLADDSGDTPLHIAASTEHTDIISCLINKSADTNMKNNNGFLPSQVADLYCNEEIVSKLQGNTPKLNKLSSVGRKCFSLQETQSLLGKKSIKRSEKTIQEYYSTILKTPMVGPVLQGEESKEVQAIIETQVQTLAKKIGELDERFTSIVLHAGSSSEGTKTNFPDEFDFMLSLENFSSHCEFKTLEDDKINVPRITMNNFAYEGRDSVSDEIGSASFQDESDSLHIDVLEVSVSDYVKVSVKDGKQSDKFRQIMCSSILDCGTMNLIFSQLIERVVFGTDFPRDSRLIPMEVTLHPSLKYMWYGSRYKEMTIDVDLVPALRLPTWPAKVMRDSALFDQELQNITYMVVPKMTSGSHRYYWRCSLALVETAIFRKLKSQTRNAYIICKCIKSSNFLPSIEFEDKESEFEKHVFHQHYPDVDTKHMAVFKDVESIVPSYILKMVFLGLVEERITQWGISEVYRSATDDARGTASLFNENGNPYGPAVNMNVSELSTKIDNDLVKEVFQKSLEYLEQRFVPSVFNKKHNVLSDKLLFEGGIERAIIFLRIILELLHD